MTQEEMQEYLLNHIDINHKTLRRFAAHIGVSTAYVSSVVRGEKPPSRKVLAEIGVVKVSTVSYEMADEA